MASKVFVSQLEKFSVKLDEDTLEYVQSMLEDMSIADQDEVRGSTETFLVDADVDSGKIDEFYKEFFQKLGSGAQTDNEAKASPLAVKKLEAEIEKDQPKKVFIRLQKR
jgi:hypothetical protein